MAVASRGGMVKVFGGPGVELVLEEEGASVAGEDPPAHLLFPTPNLLVGVTATGAVLSWDLEAGGRCGSIPSPIDPATGLEERVTSVHSTAASTSAVGTTAADAQAARYLVTGFESGRVRIAHVFPACRASAYTVEPRDMSSGAPEELLAPSSDSGKCLGAVTSIASFEDRDGGGIGIFGHRHGGIVIWDWVRQKRLALRSLTPPSQGQGEQGKRAFEDEEGRAVTSIAVHPFGEVFTAGFASGCYAVFSASAFLHGACPPRWVHEVGNEGSDPREGPTIVRTAVSLVQWVSVRGAGADKSWGLVVAGGVEMEDGEEPDGVSLLVPPSSAPAGSVSGGGRANKKGSVAAAMATLETAVFVPFAIGQERLSHVHCVVSGADNSVAVAQNSSTLVHDLHSPRPSHSGEPLEEEVVDGTGEVAQPEQENAVDVSEELIVLGLVKWNEEVRGDDGRLHFRLASSIQACPIQISPYVALLQLAPEKFGSHVSRFATVTAVASTPLLSSSTILDFMTCLGNEQGAEGRGSSRSLSLLLRGGHLRWPESIPHRARDEALGTSELLVAGHSDGLLTFWECCGPASRQDGVSLSEGRVIMREVPSGAILLGSVPVAELADNGEDAVDVAVTALDVWVERDHVVASERNACWVAAGFDSGDATVIVLSNKMETSISGGGRKAESEGGTPLSEKPVKVSDVQLSDGTTEGDSAGGGTSGGGRGLLKRFIKRGGGQQQPSPGDEEDNAIEDAELEAAIAEARAEARAIATTEASTGEDLKKGEPVEEDEAVDTGEVDTGEGEGSENHKSEHLRQALSEAMAEEGATRGDSSWPQTTGSPRYEKEGGEEERLQLDAPRKASLVQLWLGLHSLPVRCVTLSFDTHALALALVVADAGGVVSVTDVSTGSASLLPMRVPQSRPCRPSITIGPFPTTLSGGRVPELGASGALFVLLEGWLNVFDLASRDPVDFVQVPGLLPLDGESDGDGGGGGSDGAFARSERRTTRVEKNKERSWITCVDKHGLPLLPYVSETLSTSISPGPAAPNKGDRSGDSNGKEGGSGGREVHPKVPPRAQTIWVSPQPSRTALDDYHEHELQILTSSTPPEPLLLVVRGAMALVLAIVQKEAGNISVFSRRSSQSSGDATAFKGGSGARLVVQSRATLSRVEGRAVPPTVGGAGVCLVPAGKGEAGEVALGGCLVTADSSGFVTGLLLPSLCPIFRDRLSTSDDVAGLHDGAVFLAQKSVCNFVGELTLQGMAGVSHVMVRCAFFYISRHEWILNGRV